jgi:hypothetical protein
VRLYHRFDVCAPELVLNDLPIKEPFSKPHSDVIHERAFQWSGFEDKPPHHLGEGGG